MQLEDFTCHGVAPVYVRMLNTTAAQECHATEAGYFVDGAAGDFSAAMTEFFVLNVCEPLDADLFVTYTYEARDTSTDELTGADSRNARIVRTVYQSCSDSDSVSATVIRAGCWDGYAIELRFMDEASDMQQLVQRRNPDAHLPTANPTSPTKQSGTVRYKGIDWMFISAIVFLPFI